MRPKRPRGASADQARAAKKHREKVAHHRKNPCPHAPRQLDAETELFGEYVHHPHKRHNRWVLRLWWPEIVFDADGFPLAIKHYKVRIEYSANGTDWFLHSRRMVPHKLDFDPTEIVHTRVLHIHPRYAYRYRVQAVGRDCSAEPSEFKNLGSALDVPPAPHDVRILRGSHGIRVRWRAPRHMPKNYAAIHANAEGTNVVGAYPVVGDTVWNFDNFVKEFGPADDTFFHKAIHHFVVELWTNPDFGPVLDFTADAGSNELTVTGHGLAEGDVVSLSNNHDINEDPSNDDFPGGLRQYKAYIVLNPATNTFQLGSDEFATSIPDATPINITADGTGEVQVGLARHASHVKTHHHNFRIDTEDFDEDTRFYTRVRSIAEHHSKSAFIPGTGSGNDDPEETPSGRRPAWHRRVFEFTIPGPVQAKTYRTPSRVDDDYRVRRVTVAAGGTGAGGPTLFDIKVNGATFVFDSDTAKMVSLTAGDHDAGSKQVVTRDIERGDHLRVVVEEVPATPPEDVTVQVICDRIHDGSTTDSGGGGGD